MQVTFEQISFVFICSYEKLPRCPAEQIATNAVVFVTCFHQKLQCAHENNSTASKAACPGSCVSSQQQRPAAATSAPAGWSLKARRLEHPRNCVLNSSTLRLSFLGSDNNDQDPRCQKHFNPLCERSLNTRPQTLRHLHPSPRSQCLTMRTIQVPKTPSQTLRTEMRFPSCRFLSPSHDITYRLHLCVENIHNTLRSRPTDDALWMHKQINSST